MTGRPSVLTDELIGRATAYIGKFHDESLPELPTIEGLAIALGISRDSVYELEKIPSITNNSTDIEIDVYAMRVVFSDIVSKLRNMQANKLIQNGLTGRYNSTIAKLILSGKHGYVEKSEQDITSKGESVAPQPVDKSVLDNFMESVKAQVDQQARSDSK